MRFVVALALVATAAMAGARPARALADDAVALLPLEADAKLELYGQPVASEVARALVGAGIGVSVVGPKMAVPVVARLVLDGKISGGKGDTVVLSVRIRNRATGDVIDTPTTNPFALTSIDQAAADLSSRVVPIVHQWLVAHPLPPPQDAQHPAPPPRSEPAPVARVDPPLVIAVGAPAASGQPLESPLAAELAAWARAHHRAPIVATPGDLGPKIAPLTITTHGASAGLALEIIDYKVEPGRVALARARVRLRLSDATRVVFERVIVTDTIVGDRDQPAAQLAERVAREIIAIVTPNAVRELPELGARAP